MPAEGGYTFADVCARIVDLAVERHAGAGRPPADAAGPAPMSGRPGSPGGPGRRSRRAGRDRSGGPRPGCRRVRAGAALAMLAVGRGDLRGRRVVGLRLRASSQVDGAGLTDPAAVEAALAGGPRREPVPALDRARSRPRSSGCRPSPTPASRSSCRARSRSRIDEREPVLVWQVGARRYLADATAPSSRGSATIRRPARRRRCRSSTTAGRRRPGCRVGSRLDPVDLDAATRLASLAPADVGSAAEALAVRGHRRERLRRARRAAGLARRSSASTRRACARPSSSRARSGCCAAC